VETELLKARQRELKEGRQMLFPVRLASFDTLKTWTSFDADTGRDLAREVREYFIPDFSNWHDEQAFNKEVNKLANALMVEMSTR
jgi:hypothetical protein